MKCNFSVLRISTNTFGAQMPAINTRSKGYFFLKSSSIPETKSVFSCKPEHKKEKWQIHPNSCFRTPFLFLPHFHFELAAVYFLNLPGTNTRTCPVQDILPILVHQPKHTVGWRENYRQ